MLSTAKCIVDITKRARGDENPKVRREFGDLGKILAPKFTSKYAEKVMPCLDPAALV
jgi:hypothetical protein